MNEISAPVNSNSWVMKNVLPNATGLTVHGIFYSYKVEKRVEDDFTVTLRNKDALNEGNYVFSKTDNWSGIPGNTLNRMVSLDNVSIERIGDGEFVTTGYGLLSQRNVVYHYRYDTCNNESTITKECPNYKKPNYELVEIDFTNYVTEETKIKNDEDNIKGNESREEEKKNKDKKLIVNSMLSKDDIKTSIDFQNLNNIPGFDTYSVAIPGGNYKDVNLPDARIVDSPSRRAFTFAQDRLHNSLVDLQYDSTKKER